MKGSAILAEISRICSLTKPNLFRALLRLKRQGIVERHPGHRKTQDRPHILYLHKKPSIHI